MNRFNALALLGGIFVVLPVLLFLGLRWLARRWIRTHPSSRSATAITPTGYVLCGFQVLSLLAAVYQLDFTGHFGVVLSLLGVSLVLFLAAAYLDHLGYPPTRDKGRRLGLDSTCDRGAMRAPQQRAPESCSD